MRKGIYLNVLVRADNSQDHEQSMSALKTVVNHALQNGTPIAQLTGDVKRIRMRAPHDGEAPKIETLVYLEGEQEAAQNFNELATAEVQAALQAAFVTPITPDVTAHVEAVQENPNAFDELAEEELQANDNQAT